MAHPASASGSFVRAYVCIIEVSTPYLSHGITRLDFSACCNVSISMHCLLGGNRRRMFVPTHEETAISNKGSFQSKLERTMTRPRVNQKALPSSGPCLLIPVYKLHQGKEANKNCDGSRPPATVQPKPLAPSTWLLGHVMFL
ncbi:hypothetical protein FOXB_08818 [Fusarium oxysporum f. sp. conglutinans Fo5176]|uniref:Uncharacterized protein n=1 Tax=Fusarium oxysporum (strain Fo5176) TaxID=660025 RepID=F9FQY8_FUSOF|nr:hypothetical protein FOXB_08818 [Fusarium oxysporum f. sp. conglutinans Fo5176]